MEFLNIMAQNLCSAPMLFFSLGLFAGWIESDLKIPDSISHYLSIYLMIAIGLKGGAAIAGVNLFDAQFIFLVISSFLLSLLQPFIAYWFLSRTTKLDIATAAALSAHYGSISMMTFITATAFLKNQKIFAADYMVSILALMEAPAILSGLFIAHQKMPKLQLAKASGKKIYHEIFTNGSILLLLGSFLIGWIIGYKNLEKISGFFVSPFQGFLCLFLLDMGLCVSKNFSQLKNFSLSLILFGFYMPLIGAVLGLLTSFFIGLDAGTGTLLAVLCASASYIAVPAVMRLALPEAKAAIYLPMSLVVTFPFNVSIGIPLYYSLAKKILF